VYVDVYVYYLCLDPVYGGGAGDSGKPDCVLGCLGCRGDLLFVVDVLFPSVCLPRQAAGLTRLGLTRGLTPQRAAEGIRKETERVNPNPNP